VPQKVLYFSFEGYLSYVDQAEEAEKFYVSIIPYAMLLRMMTEPAKTQQTPANHFFVQLET